MSNSSNTSFEGSPFVDLMDHSLEISPGSDGSNSSALNVFGVLRDTAAPAPAIRDISMALSDASSGWEKVSSSSTFRPARSRARSVGFVPTSRDSSPAAEPYPATQIPFVSNERNQKRVQQVLQGYGLDTMVDIRVIKERRMITGGESSAPPLLPASRVPLGARALADTKAEATASVSSGIRASAPAPISFAPSAILVHDNNVGQILFDDAFPPAVNAYEAGVGHVANLAAIVQQAHGAVIQAQQQSKILLAEASARVQAAESVAAATQQRGLLVQQQCQNATGTDGVVVQQERDAAQIATEAAFTAANAAKLKLPWR